MGGEVEVELPEAIIQSIQSLLTGKEAARTTILSKSWHSAWLTRPNLDLDVSDYKASLRERRNFFAVDEFSKYAKKTIKRYEQSNLKIDSFKLCMSVECYGGAKLAKKLIARALGKLEPTRLSFRQDGRFLFPCEAVFGAENLAELSVEGCEINLDGKAVKCCRLESLSLDRVYATRVTLSNIFSSCPLIEKLSLSSINQDEYDDEPAVAPIVDNLHRIKCLVLCYDSFEKLFPDDLLSKLPLLKDLTLNMSGGGGDVQISNCWLENIKIEMGKEERSRISWGLPPASKELKVRLDVPNIRKFSYEGGDIIPKLSFVSTTTREWESHVSIEQRKRGFEGQAVFWFRELNELLTELRQSKIHLSLHVGYNVFSDYRVGELSFTHKKHELESLALDMSGLPSFICNALLDGLFRLCRPKLITQRIEKGTNFDLLWHALEQGMRVSMIRRQLMYGLNDLEEANAQILDDDVMGGWRPPIPLKSLLLLSEEDIDNLQRVRLLLKWKKPSFLSLFLLN